MSKKKLLLTHCAHSEVPLIVAAKKLGWHVISTGDNPNAVGHKFADETFCGNFADGEFICRLAEENKVDAIVSGCEDSAYLSAAYACEKLNFSGHDTFENAKIIHNKMLFRKVIRELNLPSPKFFVCKNLDDVHKAENKVGFPIIVKPIDLNSGTGCSICKNSDELIKSFIDAQKVSTRQEIILEKYLQGSNHAANIFFKNQKVVHSFFDNEQYFINPYLVAGASSPSNLFHYTMENLNSQLEKIAEHLNLVDGMFHVQFITEPDGTPYLIDPCRRIPGGLYILFAKYASGFDVAENVILFETGEHEINFSNRINRKIVAREYIVTDKVGVIDKIFIDDFVQKKIFDRFIWAKSGDVVKNPMTYKAGILFMEFDNFQEMQDTLNNFYELVKIKFK